MPDYKQIGWQVWNINHPYHKDFASLDNALTDADKKNGFVSRPVYIKANDNA